MRVLFKKEERDFLFRKYKGEGYNNWDASDKVNSIQKYLVDFAKNLKEKYHKKIKQIEKELDTKRAKSFEIIKVKSQLEVDMENKFTQKFEEMIQKS